MRILCDQCVNTDLLKALRAHGLDVLHTREAGLSRAGDLVVFEHAQRNKRILLTFDRDFGNITQFPIRNSHGIVLVRINDMKKDEVVARTIELFTTLLKASEAKGKLFIIESKTLRTWPA